MSSKKMVWVRYAFISKWAPELVVRGKAGAEDAIEIVGHLYDKLQEIEVIS